MTPTWFEHAAFWSGVRRATVAPRSHIDKRVKKIGSTEIWTRIAGFKVQSANHYTIEPRLVCWIDFLGQDISCSMICHDSLFQCLYHFAHICLPIFTGPKKYFACFLPGSNRRPCACEAHVITTTLRKLCVGIDPKKFDGHWIPTFEPKDFSSHLGIEPRTFGLEVQRAILCANGTPH